MLNSVFLELEFFLLILFSFVIPIGIYLYLLTKHSISRPVVLLFAVLLIVLAGADVLLLRSLAEIAKTTLSTFDDKLFASELTIALYLLPVLFAGVGVNLVSHVLIGHLNFAEKNFDRDHRKTGAGVISPAGLLLQSLGYQSRVTQKIGLEWLVFMGATIAMLVIFALDLFSGSAIRLHVLYVFPLAVVALYCDRTGINIAMFALSFFLQLITFYSQSISKISLDTDAAVATAASALTILLATMVRKSHLQVQHQAATDTLTNLPNRRSFLTALDSEIFRQQRYGGVVSLALIDLDGFKALNDAQGHLAGDEALKIVAEILQNKSRATDFVARIGGDEFIALMPHTPAPEGNAICHQLCNEIASGMAAAGYAVTASIGCNTFENGSATASSALAEADAAMYRAKIAGKNNVISG